MTSDPWSTPTNPLGSQALQPKRTTRQDLVELAARALMGYSPDRPWSDDDLAPISTMGDDSSRDIFIGLAEEALDATYPLARSADQLDDLAVGDVIRNDAGIFYRRTLPGLGKVGGIDVGTSEVWEQLGTHEIGRNPRRVSSATLALSGPWTVVFWVAA